MFPRCVSGPVREKEASILTAETGFLSISGVPRIGLLIEPSAGRIILPGVLLVPLQGDDGHSGLGVGPVAEVVLCVYMIS